MLKVIALALFALAGCKADTPAAPTTPTPGIYCGETPYSVYTCLDIPKAVGPEITQKCQKYSSTCDVMKCVFIESGWMEDSKVNKKKVSDHFDHIASTHPQWSTAINHLKAACLGDHDLTAQGIHINCPPYDIMHCALASFIKNTSPSQWKATTECQYPRAYATACPICPSACFTPQVPIGACNACTTLPRSV